MKITGIFVLLALTMCCFSDVTAQVKQRPCFYSPQDEVFKCPPAGSAVCGSDNMTYSNTCLLGKAMRASCGRIRYRHQGPCRKYQKS